MSPRLALNLKSNCLHFSAALGLVLLWQMHTTKPSEEIFLIQSIKSQKGQEESEDHWPSDLKMRSGVMVDLGKGVQSEPALITIGSCLPPGILNIRTFSVHSHRWNHLDANFMKKDTQKHYEQADPEVTEQGDRTLWPESPCPNAFLSTSCRIVSSWGCPSFPDGGWLYCLGSAPVYQLTDLPVPMFLFVASVLARLHKWGKFSRAMWCSEFYFSTWLQPASRQRMWT